MSRIKIFTLPMATDFLAFIVQGILPVAVSFIFQRKMGFNIIEIGLFLTPWPLMSALMTFLATRLSGRYPVGLLESIRLAILGCGLGMVTFIPPHSPPIYLIIAMAMAGSFFVPRDKRIFMESVPEAQKEEARRILKRSHTLGIVIGGMLAFLFCLDVSIEHGAEIVLSLGALMAFLASVMSFSRLLKPAHS